MAWRRMQKNGIYRAPSVRSVDHHRIHSAASLTISHQVPSIQASPPHPYKKEYLPPISPLEKTRIAGQRHSNGNRCLTTGTDCPTQGQLVVFGPLFGIQEAEQREYRRKADRTEETRSGSGYSYRSHNMVGVTGASHGLTRSGTRSLVLNSRSLERSGFAITGGEHGREELKDSDQISEDSTERT